MKWKKANKKVTGWDAALASLHRSNKRRDKYEKPMGHREALRVLWAEVLRQDHRELIQYLGPLQRPNEFKYVPYSVVMERLRSLRDCPVTSVYLTEKRYSLPFLAKNLAMALATYGPFEEQDQKAPDTSHKKSDSITKRYRWVDLKDS